MSSNLIASVLKDRILLGNGISIVEPESVPDLFLRGLNPSQILVDELNEEVISFNQRSPEPLRVFDENTEITYDKSWLIPDEYLNLDLDEFFMEKLKQLPETIQERAEVRIENELLEVKNRKFENGLRTIIYVIDIFKKNNQVWGVGRGSSCASYLLYLCDLHKVDCLKYNIHWTEFFHD